MTTAIAAAMASFQMIDGGEDNTTEVIEIKIIGTGIRNDFLTDQRNDLRRVIQASRVRRQRGKTALTQTGRNGLSCGQKAQNMRGHAGFVAPARTLVEAAFGNTTMIRLATYRTMPVG